METTNSRRCSLACPSCAVCGTVGARYHYGGLVCRSCRVFFFRHVKNNKQLVCKSGGHCPIILGNSRHACAACRFQKCIEANMDFSIVGRKTKSCPSNFNDESLKLHGILHPEPLYPVLQFKSSSMEIEDEKGASSSLFSPIVPTSLPISTSLLPSPLLSPFCTDSSLWSSPLLAQTFLDGLECYPELAALTLEDKNILVQQNYHLFGSFSQKYSSWEMKKSAGWTVPSGQSELLFHSTNITEAEFVILKVLCLLSPVLLLSSMGQWQLMMARTRFISLLMELAGKENPLWSHEKKWLRVSLLLKILPTVKRELTSSAAAISSQS